MTVAPASRLTRSQLAVWFAQEIRGRHNRSFETRHVYRIRGTIDLQALDAAVRALLARHTSLRTLVVVEGSTPLPRVGAIPETCVQLHDAPTGSSIAEQAENFRRVDAEEIRLDRQLPFRVHFTSLSAAEHLLLIVAHHIVLDGWSLNIVHDELAAAYAAAAQGVPLPAEPARTTVTVADLEDEDLAADSADDRLDYWREMLRDAPVRTTLPGDRSNARAVSDYRATRLSAHLPDGLSRLGAEHGASAFAVVVAAIAASLKSWCDTDDIVVGMAVAARELEETEDVVAGLADAVPVRFPPGTAQRGNTTSSLISSAQEAILLAQANRLPFHYLLERLDGKPRDQMAPFYNVMVASHHGFGTPLRLGDARIDYVHPTTVHAVHDLTIYVGTGQDLSRLDIDYRHAVVDQAMVEQLLEDVVNRLTWLSSGHDHSEYATPSRTSSPATDSPAADSGHDVGHAGTDTIPRQFVEQLQDIWERVLQRPLGDPRQNFFAIGGTSLRALAITTAVRERWEVRIPIRLLYVNSTFADFAAAVWVRIAEEDDNE